MSLPPKNVIASETELQVLGGLKTDLLPEHVGSGWKLMTVKSTKEISCLEWSQEFRQQGTLVGSKRLICNPQKGTALSLINRAPPSLGLHHMLCLPTDQSIPAYFAVA